MGFGLVDPAPAWQVITGDCLEVMRGMADASVDAVVTDPPYPEIDRPYGRMTEPEWHAMMDGVVAECRRVLKPAGSAVFIIQPNSDRIGRMRPWVWEFMAKWTRDWNMVQDAWWWNPTAAPTAHCQRARGLMRPSVKPCVWLGDPSCYRNQDGVLWKPSDAMMAMKRSQRGRIVVPSGLSVDDNTMVETVEQRGGVTPFNLLPIPGRSGQDGPENTHGAQTPLDLAVWWTRYICPPGGTVLDPFNGVGTMGVAAMLEGCSYVGIERDPEYAGIARARIAHAAEERAGRLF